MISCRMDRIWLMENRELCRWSTVEGLVWGWQSLYDLWMARKMSVASSRRVAVSLLGMLGCNPSMRKVISSV